MARTIGVTSRRHAAGPVRCGALLIGCAVAGTAALEAAPAQRPAASTRAQSSPQANVERHVVMLRGSVAGTDFIGAGLIFAQGSDRLYIVTGEHVVRQGPERASTVEVLLKWLPGEWSTAVVTENVDRNLDVAVIILSGTDDLQVPTLDGRILDQVDGLAFGHDVRPIAYPSRREWFVPPQPHKVASVTGQTIATQGSLEPGHSGGVLVTDNWGVVGLLTRVDGTLAESSRLDRILEALAGWGYPIDIALREASEPPPRAEEACEISGLVFDEDRNAPLPAVNLDLGADSEDGRIPTVQRVVATTGPDGRFSFRCSEAIERERYPLRIKLWHPNWTATVVSPVTIEYGARRADINIPLRVGAEITLRQPPYEPQPPLPAGPVGTQLTVAAERARSFDIATGRLGDSPAGGDFYFSGRYPGFWANNAGQCGVQDLGPRDESLNRIRAPASGYHQQGVNARVGHVYAACSGQRFMVFRVLDIAHSDGVTHHYRIQYVTVRRRDHRDPPP
jgi:hypothetical protein